MAAEGARHGGLENILSFGRDLVSVIRKSRDNEGCAQATDASRMLLSVCRSDVANLEAQLAESRKKIKSLKEKIEKVKSETVSDDVLNALQNELEQKLEEERLLRQDLRAVQDEIDNLDSQKESIEERKDALKKEQKYMMKSQNMLSMCVSVTNIMPNFEGEDKISGYIVDRSMKRVEEFEFEKTTSPVDMCSKLWKKL